MKSIVVTWGFAVNNDILAGTVARLVVGVSDKDGTVVQSHIVPADATSAQFDGIPAGDYHAHVLAMDSDSKAVGEPVSVEFSVVDEVALTVPADSEHVDATPPGQMMPAGLMVKVL